MRERVPLSWAQTQNNLGNALKVLGDREGRYGRALKRPSPRTAMRLPNTTRERVPLSWATTQNNLGTALKALGDREAGTARLEEAIHRVPRCAYRNARAEARFHWPGPGRRNSLGNALRILGEREAGTARLEEGHPRRTAMRSMSSSRPAIRSP